jgi:hypothetical protein
VLAQSIKLEALLHKREVELLHQVLGVQSPRPASATELLPPGWLRHWLHSLRRLEVQAPVVTVAWYAECADELEQLFASTKFKDWHKKQDADLRAKGDALKLVVNDAAFQRLSLEIVDLVCEVNRGNCSSRGHCSIHCPYTVAELNLVADKLSNTWISCTKK